MTSDASSILLDNDLLQIIPKGILNLNVYCYGGALLKKAIQFLGISHITLVQLFVSNAWK